jgi:outer membrane protein OmpA-like peptidoglycan-associated protein
MVLGACEYHQPPPPQPENTSKVNAVAAGTIGGAVTGAMLGVPVPIFTAIGAISGAALGAQLGEETHLDKLQRAYVQVIAVGEDMMLVLPSTYYFYPNSTHMNESLYPALDHIAEYMSEFQPPMIKVSGYTDNVGDATRNLALSRQQAQQIASYLWSKSFDGRMIYAVGYGDQYPIATNDTPGGRATNRRIQITFRRVDRKIG